jgi:hypothetical protein
MADYVTLADVKAHATTPQWGSDYDSLIPVLITRASEFVDRLTRREVGAYDAADSATARRFSADGGLYLPIDECVEVTAVAIRETSTTTSWTDLNTDDYVTWPYNASGLGEPIIRLDIDRRSGSETEWPKGREAVKVTARWGYSDEPPAVVEEAVIAQVIRWLKKGEQMFADASMMKRAGTLTYAKQMSPVVRNTILDSHLVKGHDYF